MQFKIGWIYNESLLFFNICNRDNNCNVSDMAYSKMSQTLKPKFVAGIVITDPNLSKEQARENPYSFWEIDTDNENVHSTVLEIYKKYNVDVVSQRIGKGWHYFGDKMFRDNWKILHDDLVRLSGNKEFPALTLRISKKYPGELFERPVYHQNKYPPASWARALMHYLNKEMKCENSTNLHQSMKDCGLPKFFICVVYPVCPICLVSGFDDVILHMQKEHGDKA